ncbi:MAG: alpha-galactosidase [Planctomycetes bacterium]|nr:alpha-galactosidase [Planctomycetota bacterium]
MINAKHLLCAVITCIALVRTLPCQGASLDFTDIAVSETPDHEVRFHSGNTVYVEGLVNSQWAGRYWAANGRVNFPYWRYAESAFKIEIKDDPVVPAGTLLSAGWQWVSAAEAPKTDRGARHFIVELANTTRPLKVKVHTLIDGTPVLVRWLEITNAGDKPLALTGLAPWAGRLWPIPRPFVMASSMPWYTFIWKTLPAGMTVVESVQGNGYDDPFFIVRNDAEGTYFIGHLAWSANYRIAFEHEPDGAKPRTGLSFRFGPSAKDALRVIVPGETAVTPAVHLGHLEGDLDAAVQAMHDHVRRFVVPPRNPKRAHLIQLNTPGDQGYFTDADFNEVNLRKCIDVAAETGCELFLVDCPWYDNYGDWVPSPSRFPNGLAPLVEYAHQKGLLLGLQTEVEGGRNNWSRSRINREHRDWFGDKNIMRLERLEVAAYMEDELTRVVKDYKPDLYRNEFIPIPNEKGEVFTYEWMSTARAGFLENDYWRYYDNWNRVWENLRGKFPDVIWQQCANGGTREDLAAIGRFDESYTSEGPTEAMLRFFSGKTLCLPPEILVIGITTAMELGHLDTYLRAQYTLSTPQIVTALAPTVEQLSPRLRERCLHYADIYKKFIRPLLPTCRVYHHAPNSMRNDFPEWFVMEFASPDRSKAWATIVHLSPSQSDTFLFRPRGLARDKKYRVTFDSTGDAVVVDGWRLTQEGILLRLEAVMASEVLLFKQD